MLSFLAAAGLSLALAAADAAPAKIDVVKPAENGTKEPFKQTKNVVYDDVHGIALVLDVFEPTGKKNGLGIVLIASGSYYSDRSKIEMFRRAQMYDLFCSQGYTVFAVRPGSITKFTLPEMLAHVRRGIRWVKSQSDEYGVDPNRIGLTGASAGGHLCCLAAVTPEEGKSSSKDKLERESTAVKAACAFFPPTDFLRYGKGEDLSKSDKPVPIFVNQLLFPRGTNGKSRDEIIESLVKISPARQATSKAPPFLLIHGDADPLVPLQQSELMLESLKKNGVPAELIVKKGGAHPWPTIHEEVKVARDWFDGQLATAK